MAKKEAAAETKKVPVQYSASPEGEQFEIPRPDQYATELRRLQRRVASARKEGKEIVVVMGVGFVGAVMAAIVADTEDSKGQTQ